jgi:hypothetical protein
MFIGHGMRDSFAQRLALQHFHYEERILLVFLNFVYRADVGMIQGRCSPRFALQEVRG